MAPNHTTIGDSLQSLISLPAPNGTASVSTVHATATSFLVASAYAVHVVAASFLAASASAAFDSAFASVGHDAAVVPCCALPQHCACRAGQLAGMRCRPKHDTPDQAMPAWPAPDVVCPS